jgi:hypothetical protein
MNWLVRRLENISLFTNKYLSLILKTKKLQKYWNDPSSLMLSLADGGSTFLRNVSIRLQENAL